MIVAYMPLPTKARKLGLDLTGAPQGESHPVGGAIVPYVYASVTLRLSDGVETCEWQATVGFVDLGIGDMHGYF